MAARTRGGDCPYCTGKKVLAGFNDLATLEPGVADQWHAMLNGALTPQMVTTGSHRRAWWQCDQGHVWKAAVYSRAGPQKCGCPICAGCVSKKRLAQYAGLLETALAQRSAPPEKPGSGPEHPFCCPIPVQQGEAKR